MKIGVSGASGHLGRAVVSELLQRAGGHEVVAITRTPVYLRGGTLCPANICGVTSRNKLRLESRSRVSRRPATQSAA